MQLHEIKRKTKQKKHRQIGRGGKRGTTSGRGTKGQRARAGHRIRPDIRDMIKKLPKRRGYGKNRAMAVVGSRVKAIPVNLDVLDRVFAGGEVVTPVSLFEKKIIRRNKGKLPLVKILGRGKLTKGLTIKGCEFSDSAKAAVVAAGGKVE